MWNLLRCGFFEHWCRQMDQVWFDHMLLSLSWTLFCVNNLMLLYILPVKLHCNPCFSLHIHRLIIFGKVNINFNMSEFCTLKFTSANSRIVIVIPDLEHRIWLGYWIFFSVDIQKSVNSVYANNFQLEVWRNLRLHLKQQFLKVPFHKLNKILCLKL